MAATIERKNTKWNGDVFVISLQGKDTRIHNRIYVSAQPWINEGKIEAWRGEGFAHRRIDDEEVRASYLHLLPE